MEPATPAAVPAVPAPVAAAPPAPEPEPVAAAPAPVAAAPVEAHTAQPEPSLPSADDLTKVMGAAGGGGAGLVALVVLVAGGAAGWKFWTKFSEQKHEQKLKQMEIDAQAQGLGSAQPIPCQSVTRVQADALARLAASIEELEAKIGKIEKKTAALSGSFDADELEGWQKRVDRDLKALKTSKSKAGA